ncbi:SMI1/KNR4 family protein [Streptomyces malaysiense]|uniref:SMI1/KNR4 family protein n=1 Tax=Streptomyces malaysiense TaxID=1428626 RepID=A0A1J4Q048_9ACTN|nr:SMI1/KNR4 family protein [Streptomyces malaysiense]OIK25448.1 SMI1/KNR4 family protein [Streptomyces malaysiense]
MDPTVEQAARQITAEVVAKAPEGWTECVLRGRGSRSGVGMFGGGYVVPSRPGSYFEMPFPSQCLGSLASWFRDAHDWEAIVLELTCRPSGAFELVVFRDALQPGSGPEDGWTLTVDPGFRPSEPGAADGVEPSGLRQAGDPAEAVERLRAVLRQHAERHGAEPEMPAPVTEAQLAAAERHLGRPLPADLRALYLEADGDGDSEALDGYCWMPLDGALAERDDYIGVPTWYGWELGWNNVIFDADPPNTVRRCSGHPGWLPFATWFDGNFLAVDLAPAADGRPGQVIEVGRDFDDGPRHVASSVTAWLGQVLGRPDPHAPQQSGDDPRQLIVSALDERLAPGVQAIHLNDAGSPVDLGPLSATPHLRRLHLNRCATADLSPVAALPVEDLAVGLAAEADLTPLTGHPHLASLAVGSETPIDLAPLRTLPALRSLDLSGCPTPDLALLADLPGLRYLALSGTQWTALIATGRLPAHLAAARLAGAPPLTAALDLLAALGVDTATAYRLSGTVDDAS